MTDPNKQRRFAAWKCFQPYLTESQLLEAIAVLDLEYQTDSPISLITYVKKIAVKFGIDEAARKTLHVQFHQWLQSPATEVIDPVASISQPTTTRHTDSAASMIGANTPDKTQPELSTPKSVELPPYAILFAVLTQQVLELCPKDELFAVLSDLANNATQKFPLELQLFDQWRAEPSSFNWSVELDETALIGLVHIIYTAVCEVLGPIEADRCFHKAMATCEKHPQAKLFPPARFF